MKHTTPILAAVRSMHRDDDKATGSPGRGSAHPGTNPYNTVRPLDVVAWTPEASVGAGAPMGESVTLWTDENGLDCYTNTLALEDKS